MKRINIYIADPQYEQLQALGERRGRPYSELIRAALDQYLRQQGEQRQPKKPDRQRASKGHVSGTRQSRH